MPTTIGRNRRQYVRNIMAEYTDCEKYDPHFHDWVRADPGEAWSVLRVKAARLVEEDDRATYLIRCNDTVYRLRKPSRGRDEGASTDM